MTKSVDMEMHARVVRLLEPGGWLRPNPRYQTKAELDRWGLPGREQAADTIAEAHERWNVDYDRAWAEMGRRER